MLSGAMFLGVGVIAVVIGICLTVGVIVSQIPLLGIIAWIPMGIGAIFIVVGIVLLIIRK